MEKCYVVMWDNGEDYEDHCQGVKCVCKTKEAADTLARRLNDEIEEDSAMVRKLYDEGKYKEADELDNEYGPEIYYFHLENISFFVSEEDYYDE